MPGVTSAAVDVKVEISSCGWDWLDGEAPVPLPGKLLATVTL